MNLIHEQTGVNIEHETSENFLKVTWAGDISDDDYKKLWLKLRDKAQGYGSKHLLIDQTQIGYVSMKARAWLILKWLPETKGIIGADMKTAVIGSSHAFHKSGLMYLVSAITKMSSYRAKIFDNEADALGWLLND